MRRTARDAALEDPRFPPVAEDELERLHAAGAVEHIRAVAPALKVTWGAYDLERIHQLWLDGLRRNLAEEQLRRRILNLIRPQTPRRAVPFLRRTLEGRWGMVDVDDCANGALHLAKLGKVDERRLVIRGGSAGGFTTLCALTFKRVFAAGASFYGVSDLEGFEKETHKFESRYCDRLVAPYPERRDVYARRSPVHHTDRLDTPVIFFQGLEDVIVLPNQSERMVEALKSKGVPVAYIAFEGEQHGFRKAETVIRAYGAELYFYSKVLGFPLA